MRTFIEIDRDNCCKLGTPARHQTTGKSAHRTNGLKLIPVLLVAFLLAPLTAHAQKKSAPNYESYSGFTCDANPKLPAKELSLIHISEPTRPY